MKSFKKISLPTGSIIFLLAAFVLFSQSPCVAAITPATPLSKTQLQKTVPTAVIPAQKLCPDLQVKLTVNKTGGGLVMLNGVISNIGSSDYNLPSEAQYIMNLSYPPKTYSQIGVSEQLCTKSFGQLKKGMTIPVNCTFQVPDFEAWMQGLRGGDAKRLFTLRAVKKDMSAFQPGEDCDLSNNSVAVEVVYQKK